MYFEGLPATGMTIADNIFSKATYGIMGGGTVGATATFARYAPDATLRNNVLVGVKKAQYSPDNIFLTTNDLIGWVGPVGDSSVASVTLDTFSSLKGAASDGTDPGVDVTALVAAGLR
jgi:hypothetical protein